MGLPQAGAGESLCGRVTVRGARERGMRKRTWGLRGDTVPLTFGSLGCCGERPACPGSPVCTPPRTEDGGWAGGGEAPSRGETPSHLDACIHPCFLLEQEPQGRPPPTWMGVSIPVSSWNGSRRTPAHSSPSLHPPTLT